MRFARDASQFMVGHDAAVRTRCVLVQSRITLATGADVIYGPHVRWLKRLIVDLWTIHAITRRILAFG
jgi:hypothetical protein